MTQKDLADSAGITPAHLCEIELGRRNPSPPVLAKLAKPLGTTVQELTKRDARFYVEQIKRLLNEHPDAGPHLLEAAKKVVKQLRA